MKKKNLDGYNLKPFKEHIFKDGLFDFKTLIEGDSKYERIDPSSSIPDDISYTKLDGNKSEMVIINGKDSTNIKARDVIDNININVYKDILGYYKQVDPNKKANR